MNKPNIYIVIIVNCSTGTSLVWSNMKHVLGLVRGVISPKRALGMNEHETEHLSLLVAKGFATTLDINAPVRRRIARSHFDSHKCSKS